MEHASGACDSSVCAPAPRDRAAVARRLSGPLPPDARIVVVLKCLAPEVVEVVALGERHDIGRPCAAAGAVGGRAGEPERKTG